jgi:hypothetical protein
MTYVLPRTMAGAPIVRLLRGVSSRPSLYLCAASASRALRSHGASMLSWRSAPLCICTLRYQSGGKTAPRLAMRRGLWRGGSDLAFGCSGARVSRRSQRKASGQPHQSAAVRCQPGREIAIALRLHQLLPPGAARQRSFRGRRLPVDVVEPLEGAPELDDTRRRTAAQSRLPLIGRHHPRFHGEARCRRRRRRTRRRGTARERHGRR